MKVIVSASELEDNPTVDTHNCVDCGFTIARHLS